MMLPVNFTTLSASNIEEIVTVFQTIGWDKPSRIYEEYFAEQTKDFQQSHQ